MIGLDEMPRLRLKHLNGDSAAGEIPDGWSCNHVRTHSIAAAAAARNLTSDNNHYDCCRLLMGVWASRDNDVRVPCAYVTSPASQQRLLRLLQVVLNLPLTLQ